MMTEGGWGWQTAIYFNAELSPQCLPLISKPAEQLMNSWKPHVRWWWHWKRSLEGRACSFCQEPNNGSAYRFQARRLLARVCVCVCFVCAWERIRITLLYGWQGHTHAAMFEWNNSKGKMAKSIGKWRGEQIHFGGTEWQMEHGSQNGNWNTVIRI